MEKGIFDDEILNDDDTEFLRNLIIKEFNKEFGKLSETEQRIELTKMTHLVDLFAEEYFDQMEWEERLRKEPKGFPVDVEYKPCPICGGFMTNENCWYDKNGLKCTICQKAIKKRAIPAGVCKNRAKWFSEQDLKNTFQLSTTGINKMLKQGKLKARNIMTLDGIEVYFRVFIERENRQFVHEHFIKVFEHYETKEENKPVTIRS